MIEYKLNPNSTCPHRLKVSITIDIWQLNCNAAFVAMLVILFFAGAAPMIAQEKKAAPPPTSFEVKPDSANQKVNSKRKRKKAKSKKKDNLNLPEVKIYGKNTTRHIGGEKKSVAGDKTELIVPDVDYQPMPLSDVEQGQRQTVQKENAGKYQQVRSSLFGGQFAQMGASTEFWLANDHLDFGFDAGWQKSDGEFANQNSELLDAGFSFGYAAQKRKSWRLKFRHSSNDFGLYGALADSSKRNITGNQFDITVKSPLPFDVRGKANLQFKLISIDGNRSQGLLDERKVLSIDARISKNFDNIEFNFLPFAYFNRSIGGNLTNAYFDWFSLTAKSKIPFSSKFVMDISAAGQAIDFGVQRTNHGLFNLSALYVPSATTSVKFRFLTGYRFLEWQKLIQHNRFITNNLTPQVEKVSWSGAFSFDWRLRDAMTFSMSYSLQRIENFHYFERDSAGLFITPVVELIQRQFAVGLKFEPAQNLTLEGLLKLEDYNLQNVVLNGRQFYDLPYFPAIRMPVKLSFTPWHKFKFSVNGEFIGERAFLLMDEGKLPAYSAVSANVVLQVNEHLDLFFEGNNLTNSHHEIWQGYKAVGFNVLGGIHAAW